VHQDTLLQRSLGKLRQANARRDLRLVRACMPNASQLQRKNCPSVRFDAELKFNIGLSSLKVGHEQRPLLGSQPSATPQGKLCNFLRHNLSEKLVQITACYFWAPSAA
jgi:hypothetical protein